jgi:carboxymethylenebutenolidase
MALDRKIVELYDEYTHKPPDYEKALKAAGIRYEAIVYPDVDHAFMNDTSAERYNAATAKQAWARTVAFLKAETGTA